MNKKQKEAIARGLQVVDIRPPNEDKFRRPTLEGGFGIFSRAGSPQPQDADQAKVVRADEQELPRNQGQREDTHTSDGQIDILPSDRREPLTVRGKIISPTSDSQSQLSLPPTVGNEFPPTPSVERAQLLPSDGQGEVSLPPTIAIPLSPVQWQVLQLLHELESHAEICSYRDIATRINGKREGVKSAVQVLHKVGAFLEFSIVRTAKTQGIQFRLDPTKQFHETSLRKSKGLPKRGSHFPLTVGGRGEASTRMYVSSSLYRNTYIRDLLKLFPPHWQIREQTLQQIWRGSPNMSGLEFRRSLLHLIEQTKTGPEVKNPNAWLKGAFERNSGPIITESMIEAQLERRPAPIPKITDVDKDRRVEEAEVLHAYLAADTEAKAQIDRMAEERIDRLLKRISSEKHAGVREQARLECAREFFATKAKGERD
jgi:hypothetical protein